MRVLVDNDRSPRNSAHITDTATAAENAISTTEAPSAVQRSRISRASGEVTLSGSICLRPRSRSRPPSLTADMASRSINS